MAKYWLIRGADQNVDMGGSHYQPILGIFIGTRAQAEEYARALPACIAPWTHDRYEGSVEEVNVLRTNKGRKKRP